MFVFFAKENKIGSLSISEVIEGSNTFNYITSCPEIVDVVRGENRPQYGDDYKSVGSINSHTNGDFVRRVKLSDGTEGVYQGSCSPSGRRSMTIGDKEYSFGFGQYWPGL